MLNDIPEVFPEYRFKVEFICNVEVGGNRFRVAIHHDGLKSGFLRSQYTMHAG